VRASGLLGERRSKFEITYQEAMLADADIAVSIGAVAIASMGLAVMHKAYSGAILRARTIGRARADADPGVRVRRARASALKRPKTLADVALPHERSCAGAGSPDHGPLVFYGLRFLPEETASLTAEFELLQPDRSPRDGEALAVFSALGAEDRDAGARRLARRLRAAAVFDGSVDAFPLACCFPASVASTAPAAFFAEAMGSDDPPFVSAEPLGPALASWNKKRLEAAGSAADSSASSASRVLVVRLSGEGAEAFARDLDAEGRERGAVADGGLAWIPAAVFAVQ
jgi:hypothetical protein